MLACVVATAARGWCGPASPALLRKAMGKKTGRKVANHVMAKVHKYNTRCAVRVSDVIDIEEKKKTKIRGKGKSHLWLPTAVQRVCWGVRPLKQRRRTAKTPPANDWCAPSAGSMRGLARFLEAGHSYVQQVRNATAELFMALQSSAIRHLPRAQIMFLELACDETEVPVKLDLPNETAHMLVVHVTAVRYAHGEPLHFELVLPPAWVESTAARHLYAAISARLPYTLTQLQRTVDKTVLILNTDSAQSCLKLGRQLGTLLPTLPAPCRMHQFCIALCAPANMMALKSAIFCATLLLKRKRVQTRVRAQLRKHIDDNLCCTFVPPEAGAGRGVRAIMGLMKSAVLR